MAVTLGKSPVILDAQGDSIGNDGKQWKVTTIRFVTGGTSGQFILFDKSGGREIIRSGTLNANTSEESGAIFGWIDGVYVSQLPTGGLVHVYYA